MLTRLAACLLSVGLLGNAASAHSFARPPQVDQVSMIKLAPRAPDRAEVRDALAKRRAKNLASFRAYWNGGVYPHNTFRVGPLNVWIDAEGRLCAAATMISKDGKHQLVLDTGKTNNQIRLLNVTEGSLLDWILMSGLTIEEIDAIQEPAVYPDGRVEMPLPIEPTPDYAAEDAKLRRHYARVDAQLVKNRKSSLDRAVDRLMKNPKLAQQLVDGEA